MSGSTDSMASVALLRQWIGESRRIVCFGGAGFSTESRIPDFRSASGLYATETAGARRPEEVLSRSFFFRYPEEFYRFYKAKMLHPDALPNRAHRALAELERQGRLSSIITQNIDGLHQLAGSERVLELHGSVYRNSCVACGAKYLLADVVESEGTVPVCSVCGSLVKPEVVLYEEALDADVLSEAAEELRHADLLIVGGTSLTVQPAAGLVRLYPGERLVLINQSETPYDRFAQLVIREPLGRVLGDAVFGPGGDADSEAGR